MQHACDAVANGGGAAVADMQRAGGIRGDIFDADRLAFARTVAAIGRALFQRGHDFALVGGGAQVEIDEARACDLDVRDVIAGRQRGDQCLCQRARIAARRLGQQHRGIGGKVAVLAGLGALDHEIRGGGVGRQGASAAQSVNALGDQGAELGFQRSSAGNADHAE